VVVRELWPYEEDDAHRKMLYWVGKGFVVVGVLFGVGIMIILWLVG
jgi:hypothetical protein